MAEHSHRFFFFFFNDTATTEIYTLSLHDALPIFLQLIQDLGCQRSWRDRDCKNCDLHLPDASGNPARFSRRMSDLREDRKSTRLNSSHDQISYAVFCLKKKKTRSPCRPTGRVGSR